MKEIKNFPDRKLEKTISLKEGDLLDESILKEDQNLISEKYLEKGYWNSSVDVSVDRGNGEVPVNIRYKIVEGEKRTISKILFSGNKALDSQKITQGNGDCPLEILEILVKALEIPTGNFGR